MDAVEEDEDEDEDEGGTRVICVPLAINAGFVGDRSDTTTSPKLFGRLNIVPMLTGHVLDIRTEST